MSNAEKPSHKDNSDVGSKWHSLVRKEWCDLKRSLGNRNDVDFSGTILYTDIQTTEGGMPAMGAQWL